MELQTSEDSGCIISDFGGSSDATMHIMQSLPHDLCSVDAGCRWSWQKPVLDISFVTKEIACNQLELTKDIRKLLNGGRLDAKILHGTTADGQKTNGEYSRVLRFAHAPRLKLPTTVPGEMH